MAMMDRGVPIAVSATSYSNGQNGNMRTAGFTVSVEYSNYSEGAMFVKTQNNLIFVVEPNKHCVQPDEARPHLEIKIKYTLHNNAGILGTYDLLNALRENDAIVGDEVEQLRVKISELYRQDASRFNKNAFSFTIFKRILEDEIKRNKLLMVRECNVLVTKEREYIVAPHPYSNEGLQQVEVNNNKLYHGQAGVFVKVIDNEFLARQRYFYAGKQLITVPSGEDQSKDSGVYCTVSTMDSDGMVTPKTQFYTFAEAEEAIGLYRSQEEALTHGDPEMALKAEEIKHRTEEKRLARELFEIKAENDRIKSAAEQETIKLERDLSSQRAILEDLRMSNTRLKEEIERTAMLRSEAYESKKKQRDDFYEEKDKKRKDHYEKKDKKRKDYYEERSHERKDWTEMLKFGPAVILGVLGALAFTRSKA